LKGLSPPSYSHAACLLQERRLMKTWHLWIKDHTEIPDCSEEYDAETRKEAIDRFINLVKEKTGKDYPYEEIDKFVLVVL